MSVNNVRKQTKNDDVASMAKQLIKGWKKLVSGTGRIETFLCCCLVSMLPGLIFYIRVQNLKISIF